MDPGAHSDRNDTVRIEVIELLRAYAREASRIGDVFASHHGMHSTDGHALLTVLQAEDAGAPLSPGRLGADLGLSSGATTAVLDRLERHDYLFRRRDQRDRRRVTLHVADAGLAVGRAFFGPLTRRVLGAHSEGELVQFRDLLRRMTEEVTAHREELESPPRSRHGGAVREGEVDVVAGTARNDLEGRRHRGDAPR